MRDSLYEFWLWSGKRALLELGLSAMVGALIATLVIITVIHLQRRSSAGQQIYEDGPKSHRVKHGTPTMGGVAFIVAGVASAVMKPIPNFASEFAVVFAGLIGFADDLTILLKQRALGLRARWKMLLLLGLALVVALTSLNQNHPGGFDMVQYSGRQYQWWFGSSVALPGAWYWILAVLAVVGCANAVNLTDGVDGLAAGTVIAPLLLLTLLTLNSTGAAVLGALVVFLFFNKHPARVFMGDTGSLALGALLAALAIDAHLLLFLPLLGIVFVIETLSVIAQVISFKLTGKRILKMSPLHHHFELSGWSERRVTATFSAVSVLASLIFCGIVYLSNLRVPPH